MKDINLLPDEMRSRESTGYGLEDLRDKLDPKKVLMAMIIILGLAALFFAPLLIDKILLQRLSSLEAESKSTEYNKVREVNQLLVQANGSIQNMKSVISDIDNATLTFSEIYSAVNGILPAGCTLASLSYDENKVTINGSLVEDIQIGEIISRAKRLNFLLLDDKAAISFGNDKNFNFSFNVRPEMR